jgi:acetylornithine deacetylase
MTSDDVGKRILSAVEELEDELVELVSRMVQIPSITPNYGAGIVKEEVLGGETRVNELVQPVMESIGLETDMWEAEKGRSNLVGVYKGSDAGRSLIFNGHVDVVPPGPEELWTEAGPWSGRVVDGRIYGRGACDMKGGNGAAIIALKALLGAGYRPKGDVIIESVIGEEMMDEVGTRNVIERGYTADGGIVVEPTAPPYRLGIAPASPGVMIAKITIKGKAAHTCMRDELVRAGGRGAEVAVSAMDKGFLIYRGLLQLEEEWGRTKVHPAFTRPGHFTLCPTTFHSGEGIAAIPEECIMQYVVWHAPQDTAEQVKAQVEEQIDRFAQTDAWLRENPPEVDWGTFWWPPYNVPLDAPICRAVATAYEGAMDEPARIYGFPAVDDATFLNQAGIPTVTIGPGHLGNAHSANEYVEVEELLDAARIYALSIAEWCGVDEAV